MTEHPQQSHNQTPINKIDEKQSKSLTQRYEQSSKEGAPHHMKKKKRRHHKKIKIQRDPEEIKQIRMLRLNLKKEDKWNSRFAFDLQTDHPLSKVKTKKINTLKPKKSQAVTAYVDDNPIFKHKLPNLTVKQVHKQTKSLQKNTNKSFNVRSLKSKKSKKQQPIVIRTQRQNVSEQNQITKQQKKKINYKEQLLNLLQQYSQKYKISKDHRLFIQNLIGCVNGKKNKQLRQEIERQIKQIGVQNNNFNAIEEMIRNRKQLIKQILNQGQNCTFSKYENFQINSLVLVQEILKYKAKWEQFLSKKGNKNNSIEFTQEGKNYLLTMSQETKGVLSQEEIDPFLVCKIAKFDQFKKKYVDGQISPKNKQFMLKLRACQLLLIEQQVTSEIKNK